MRVGATGLAHIHVWTRCCCVASSSCQDTCPRDCGALQRRPWPRWWAGKRSLPGPIPLAWCRCSGIRTVPAGQIEQQYLPRIFFSTKQSSHRHSAVFRQWRFFYACLLWRLEKKTKLFCENIELKLNVTTLNGNYNIYRGYFCFKQKV